MPRHTLDQLEGLSQELHHFSFQSETSDTDSMSLESRSTKATSICSDGRANSTKPEQEKIPETTATAGPRDHPGVLPFRQKANFVGDRIENSALILECLHDMVSQENALIESAMAGFCNDLKSSVGMNSVEVAKNSLFPFRKT